MSDWWFDPEELPPPLPKEEKKELDWSQKFCNHEWKQIVLIISKVYDCKICKIKKEDFERWEAGKWEL